MLEIRYFWHILYHKILVFKGGRKLGVPYLRLLLHDLSKFSKAERNVYMQFLIHGVDTKSQEYMLAVNHHYHSNDHHPEYWVYFDRNLTHPSFPLDMPEVCIREMIADWMAVSKVKNNNHIDWYYSVGYKFPMTQKTREITERILKYDESIL